MSQYISMVKETRNAWLETILGKQLLLQEQSVFDIAVSDVFGFHAVQINFPALACLRNSRIPSKLTVGVDAGELRCESTFLPFAENSIDLLCLPHVLEFSENPHQTLREVSRVLMPEGYLIMSVFNPYSLWGVKRLFSKKQTYPWHGQFFPLYRIKDWLALLGLEFVEVQFINHAPPVNNERWLKRFGFLRRLGRQWFPMTGGQYIVVAKKRVVNLTLIKPNWKKSLLRPDLVVSGHKKHKQSKGID